MATGRIKPLFEGKGSESNAEQCHKERAAQLRATKRPSSLGVLKARELRTRIAQAQKSALESALNGKEKAARLPRVKIESEGGEAPRESSARRCLEASQPKTIIESLPLSIDSIRN